MSLIKRTFISPLKDPIVANLFLSISWERFFQALMDLLSPIGFEISVPVDNNVSIEKKIDGLQFDQKVAQFYSIEYLIKRVKLSGPTSADYYESGLLHVIYKNARKNWTIRKVFSGPDVSGVTFTINSNGQVFYTSTNLTGTYALGKLTFRVVSMKAQVAKDVSIL